MEIGRSGVDSQAITEEAILADARFSETQASQVPAEGLQDPSRSVQIMLRACREQCLLTGRVPRTQRSRQIALVIALSVTGLLSAVTFFGWFVYSWGQQGSQQVAPGGALAELDAVDPTHSDSSIVSDEIVVEDNLTEGTASSIDVDGTKAGDSGTDNRESPETTNPLEEPNGGSGTGSDADTDPLATLHHQ